MTLSDAHCASPGHLRGVVVPERHAPPTACAQGRTALAGETTRRKVGGPPDASSASGSSARFRVRRLRIRSCSPASARAKGWGPVPVHTRYTPSTSQSRVYYLDPLPSGASEV